MTRATFAAAAALALLAVLPSPAPSPLTLNLALLREAICHHETRGEADVVQAIGPGQELGRCQIKPSTAVQYRRGEHLSAVLQEVIWRPEGITDDILAACAPRALPHLGAYGLAVLYNQGCRFRGRVSGRLHEYAKNVAIKYADAIFARRLKAAGLKPDTHD